MQFPVLLHYEICVILQISCKALGTNTESLSLPKQAQVPVPTHNPSSFHTCKLPIETGIVLRIFTGEETLSR